MTDLLDRAARERIASDLEANLCIEAGAGTGKTTVLVSRVASLLASGRVRADELAVITFTEKAAAELSTRVRDELERRARDTAGDERQRLLDAARDLHRAHIETIHAFAAALLRERPVEAGLDPQFEVLGTLAGDLSFDAEYERFEDDLLSLPLPELELALRRGVTLAEIRSACELLNEHRYLLPLAIPQIVAGDVAAAVRDLRAIADEMLELMRRHSPPGDDGLVGIVEGIGAWVRELEALDDGDRERALLFRDCARTHLGVGSDRNWGGEKARVKELQQALRDLFTGTRRLLRSNALLGLLPHVERFVRDYESERRRGGVANFDDLLIWARDLVRDSAPARSYFRRRFRAMLIDEFQDTDPVQAELALLLASDAEPPGDWRSLRPAPGRLTVVGDPKQSIYRFRRADIAIYDEVRTGALAGGHLEISSNFRSNPQLLEALNSAFDAILVEERGIQPGNVALVAPAGASAARRAPIVLAEGSFDGRAGDVREREADVIAALLHDAHAEAWEVRDRRHGNRLRACRWGDMAILMPARTDLEHYERALAAAAIPYRHEGGRDFFQREEVRDLILVLSAIDDPTDRVALVGALRSSAFGCSDEDLVLHVAGGGALNYRARVAGPLEHVNSALAELADLHDLRRRFSLAETVRRVVERTRLVEFAQTLRDGAQGAANLLAIVDAARAFAAAGAGGVRPFIRYLHDSTAVQAAEIDASVAEETDDVVRIMTVHGAKGLEYPIVALANLHSAPSSHVSPVPRESEHLLHFRVGVQERGYFETPGFDAVWAQEQVRAQAERHRLLYVAATRARDHLIVPCVMGASSAEHLLGDLVAAIPVDARLVSRVDADGLAAPAGPVEAREEPTNDEVAAAAATRERWIDAERELRVRAGRERPIENASSRERAYGPLAAEVATFGATLVVGEGPPIPVGDAVHMVMERVSLPDGADLETIADDVCLEGDIAEQKDDVIAMCRACLRSPSVQTAVASGGCWREVPFGVVGDGRYELAIGRVDMVSRHAGGLTVIDYKTDRDVTAENAVEHALEHHGGQAEVYATALTAATGLPVDAVVFVYCRAGVEVAVRGGSAEIGGR